MYLKPEKCERRGKYAGTKIHLGAEASQLLIDLYRNHQGMIAIGEDLKHGQDLLLSIGRCLSKLIIEYPDMLKDRTPEQVKAELENEFESAKQKLKAIEEKGDWKEVKVPVKKVKEIVK